MAALSLYLAVNVDDVDACRKKNEVPRRYVGNNSHIGLRATSDDAMTRAQQVSWTPVDKNNHVILQVNFSPAGCLHYATLPSSPEYKFKPILSKMVYDKDNDTDWNVWHFNTDLPLESGSLNGDVWIRTVWFEVE